MYVGEYWRAFRWLLIGLGLQLLIIPLLFLKKTIPIYAHVYSIAYLAIFIGVLVWEFRSIRPSIERVNKEIGAENSD